MMKPMWTTLWQFFKKLNIGLSYDPAIPFLGICPQRTGNSDFNRYLYSQFHNSIILNRQKVGENTISIDK